MNNNEKLFIEVYGEGKTYQYHPAWFHLSSGTKYMPDFYCKEDDTYIEVSGTKQAYHDNKKKYRQFVLDYPNVKFKIIHLYKYRNIIKQISKEFKYDIRIEFITEILRPDIFKKRKAS